LNITDEIIQKVKDSNDIVDIISESVRLKRAGRYYTGLCPFHNEKTPSFTVTPDKQIYKCFGCGEGGNVISFIMKTKNLDFQEAVKFLADKANIQLEAETPRSIKVRETNEKIYKINVDAARYFYGKLRKNKNALNYFRGRGITDSTLTKFGLGYSIDSWNELLNHLRSKGYTELDMLNAGLIIKNEKNKLYDRFRNRVMFPVFDIKGKVIGFGGRVLDDSKPKYLNSPETALFKKGTNLYGLNFALKDLKQRIIVIVEGYMDCISLHQYGITNAVASLGTALTVNQTKLLKRYADKIIIAYDADLAGQTATLRGLEILRNEGFDIGVLTVPQGKDPDEFIRTNGKEAFAKLIDNALPLVDYRIKKAREGINFNKPEMLASFAKDAALIVNDLNPLEKDIYIKRISEDTGIKEQALYDLISEEIQKNVNKLDFMNIDNNFGQKLYLEPAYMKAERSILKLMNESTDAYNYIVDNFNENDFIIDSHIKLFSLIKEYINVDYEERQKLIQLKCIDLESSKEYVNLEEAQISYEDNDYIKLIDDCFKEIKRNKLEVMKKNTMIKIKQFEEDGKLKDSLKLAQQLIAIKKELAKL
jgi:DNA primase